MAVQFFYSYSREDELWGQKLESRLKQHGLVSIWNDRAIKPGTAWVHAITTELETTQGILLLVSQDFLVSNYCRSFEQQHTFNQYGVGSSYETVSGMNQKQDLVPHDQKLLYRLAKKIARRMYRWLFEVRRQLSRIAYHPSPKRRHCKHYARASLINRSSSKTDASHFFNVFARRLSMFDALVKEERVHVFKQSFACACTTGSTIIHTSACIPAPGASSRI